MAAGRLTGLDRFATKIVVDENGCWLWTGSTSPDGYGRCGGTHAHRYAYKQIIGEVPPGLQLDHLCFVKLCTNPWHLEPVTAAENTRRHYARQTHCKRGHEFNEQNTQFIGNKRFCRPCRAANARGFRRRIAAAAELTKEVP